ncbi:MAG TPA: hypothetical protein VJN89_15590 [Candidatus Acidoferrum sp.]|nr:hypothetical protein [Candidatus Acidoferrum sp.]
MLEVERSMEKEKAESRKQKAESRKQKAESRKQKAESRKQKAESRKQKAEELLMGSRTAKGQRVQIGDRLSETEQWFRGTSARFPAMATK